MGVSSGDQCSWSLGVYSGALRALSYGRIACTWGRRRAPRALADRYKQQYFFSDWVGGRDPGLNGLNRVLARACAYVRAMQKNSTSPLEKTPPQRDPLTG